MNSALRARAPAGESRQAFLMSLRGYGNHAGPDASPCAHRETSQAAFLRSPRMFVAARLTCRMTKA
jgi:hypothetical protein